MPRPCSSCSSAVHLTSSCTSLASRLLTQVLLQLYHPLSSLLMHLSYPLQVMCALCWRPLAPASWPPGPLAPAPCSPLMATCGHLFHPSCLADRGRTYPDTPDRCRNSFTLPSATLVFSASPLWTPGSCPL